MPSPFRWFRYLMDMISRNPHLLTPAKYHHSWNCTNELALCPPCGDLELYNQTIGNSAPFWLGTASCQMRPEVRTVFDVDDKMLLSELDAIEKEMSYYYHVTLDTDKALAEWKVRYDTGNQAVRQEMNKGKSRKISEGLRIDSAAMSEKFADQRRKRDHYLEEDLTNDQVLWDVHRLKQLTSQEEQNNLRRLGVILLTHKERKKVRQCDIYRTENKVLDYRENNCDTWLGTVDAARVLEGKHAVLGTADPSHLLAANSTNLTSDHAQRSC